MKRHAMNGYLLTALAFLILCLVFNIDILTVGMKREFQYVLLHSFQIIYTLIIVLLVFLLYICEKNISESKLWLVDLTMFVILIMVSINGKAYLQMFPNMYIALTYAVLAIKHWVTSKK